MLSLYSAGSFYENKLLDLIKKNLRLLSLFGQNVTSLVPYTICTKTMVNELPVFGNPSYNSEKELTTARWLRNRLRRSQ